MKVGRFLQIKFITFCFIIMINARITFVKEDEYVEMEFKTYAKALIANEPLTYVVFINIYCCPKIANLFILSLEDHIKIIDNGRIIGKESFDTVRPDYIFVFIETIDDFLHSLKNLQDRTFWYNRGFIQFIICKPFKNWSITAYMLETIWKNKIFNFVLVYVADKLEVHSYNMFLPNKHINLTNDEKNDNNLFANKLKNVNGYKFRVGISGLTVVKTELLKILYQKDLKNVESFIKYINGSATIVNLPPTWNKLFAPSVDFIFMMRRFPTSYLLQDTEFVSPFHKNSIIALVPKSSLISPSKYFFKIFQPDTIVAFCVLHVVIGIIAGFHNRFQFIERLFESFCCFCGGSLPRFNGRPTSSKILFTSLMIFGLLAAVMFKTSLTTNLLLKKYHKNINRISELLEINITLFVDENYRGLLPKRVRNRSVAATSDMIFTMISKGVPQGYISLQSYIMATLELEEKNEQQEKISNVFHVMKEDIVPGYTTYIFPKTSPYVDHIKKFFTFHDSLKSQYTLEDMIRKYVDYSSHYERIEWQHWESIFLIVVSGYFIAFIVFLLELVINAIDIYLRN